MILRRYLLAALACAAAGAAAPPAAAQSVHGCTGLDGRHVMASVEGAGGTFFRLDPDLRNFHPLSDESIADLAALARRLRQQGTTLVYVPVPTRALAMPDALPQLARDYGHDPALAATIHDERIAALGRAGVQSVNLRAAWRGAEGPAPFFGTDPRITGAGAQVAAQAIADRLAALPEIAALPRTRYRTRGAGTVTLASAMHDALQRHCTIELPPVTAETFVTEALDPPAPDAPHLALIAPAPLAAPGSNLAGFLAERTGLPVVLQAGPEDDAFAAIAAYMTGPAFRAARPAVLVWMNPAWTSLANRGDQPMRELLAAAGDTCTRPLPLPGQDGAGRQIVMADLRGLDPQQDWTLRIEAEGTFAGRLRFDFLSQGGLIRTRRILRHPDLPRTGRFYMPLSGLWPEGAQSVALHFDAPPGASIAVTACQEPG